MEHALSVTLGQHSQAGGKGGNDHGNQDFHGAMLPLGPQRSTKGIALALADGIGSSAVSQEASAAAVRGAQTAVVSGKSAASRAAQSGACTGPSSR